MLCVNDVVDDVEVVVMLVVVVQKVDVMKEQKGITLQADLTFQ